MNDLNKIATLTTKAINAIKVTNVDGQISTVNIDDSNIIDLSTVWKKAEPVDNYLSSGTVVYTGNGSALSPGSSITLTGIEAGFDNIKTGLQFNFSDKSTGYTSGLFVKTTYYPIVSGVKFSNGNAFPLTLTKSQLVDGKQVSNTTSSGQTLNSETSSGTKSTVIVNSMAIEMTPTSNQTITFSDSSLLSTRSEGYLNWILNSVVVQ